MDRREEIKRNLGKRYRERKTIPAPSEESLNPRFTKRLVEHHWTYSRGRWYPPGKEPTRKVPKTNEWGGGPPRLV